jgi:hypothetical protein
MRRLPVHLGGLDRRREWRERAAMERGDCAAAGKAMTMKAVASEPQR